MVLGFSYREQAVSLLIIIVCIGLLLFFPVNRESFSQSTLGLLSFLVVLPLFYVTMILKNPLSTLEMRVPNFSLKLLWSVGMAVFVGILIAVILYSLPFNDYYVEKTATIFSNFKAFFLYHLIYIFPILLIISFFSFNFIQALPFSQLQKTTLSSLVFSGMCLFMFDLPLISILLLLVPYLILKYFSQVHFLTIVMTSFICLISFNALIAKLILNPGL